MTELFVIRHGETDWNREGRFQGHIDIPLNAIGLDQARRLAPRLAREGVQSIVASDLARAVDTAAPLAQFLKLEVRRDAGLRERSYGVFEGLTLSEIESRFPQERVRWLTRDPDYAVPGGESMREFTRRTLEALERLCIGTNGEPVCIVTHGGVLDVMHRHALGLPIYAQRRWPTRNAALNQMRLAPGTLSVVSWGDAAHLDDALD